MTHNSAATVDDKEQEMDEEQYACEGCGSHEYFEVAHEYDGGKELTIMLCSGCGQEV